MPADDRSDPADGASEGAVGDPTRQRDQPALTTSTGFVWLVVGGILTGISLVVLIPMATLPAGAVAVVAAVVIGLLYVAMVVTRLTVRPGRRRLGIMATSMLLIAAVALIATVLVAFSTAGSAGEMGQVAALRG